jgi:hypothetical protein
METSPPPWELSPKVFDQQSDECMASKSNEHGLRIPNPFALKMSGFSRAENHLRLSLLLFFLSKGWAMEEKARPRIVAAERQRLAANALRKKEVAAYHFPAGHRFIWRAAPHCILGWTAGGFMVQGTQFLRPLPPRSPSECRSTVRSTWSLRARSC